MRCNYKPRKGEHDNQPLNITRYIRWGRLHHVGKYKLGRIPNNPISLHRTQLLAALETHGILTLVGETGCGKSTMLPQYLYENGWADDDDHPDPSPDNNNSNNNGTRNYREIICTQPRRIAAISLASHLSSQSQFYDNNNNNNNNPSSIVGYTVRFASMHIPGKNKIRYVMDRWLLQECVLLDSLLRHCSVLIIDEAHERSVNTELLLATVKKICKVRPELRVIICSATLDAQSFLDYFVVGKKNTKKKNTEARKKTREPKVAEKTRDAQGVRLLPRKKRKTSRWGRVGDNNVPPTTTITTAAGSMNERLPSSSLVQDDIFMLIMGHSSQSMGDNIQ